MWPLIPMAIHNQNSQRGGHLRSRDAALVAHQQPVRPQLDRVNPLLHDDLAMWKRQPLFQPHYRKLPNCLRRFHSIKLPDTHLRQMRRYRLLPVLGQHQPVLRLRQLPKLLASLQFLRLHAPSPPHPRFLPTLLLWQHRLHQL